MIRLHDVLEGTQGRLNTTADPNLLLNHVRHDSRQVGPGDLYVAIIGERFDGHDFVPDAFARGAGAAMIDQAHLPALAGRIEPLVVVDDTVAALGRLAGYWRSLFDIPVVGITGSIGKSSTKELIASVLSQRFTTVRSQGNLNNEIGLPLSLLQITPDTEVAVLEMGGAYAFGEIRRLCAIARPRIGVVTNVSHSHVSRMGSLEAIAETKAELPESLPEDGVAVLNGDDPRVRAMADRCRCPVILYGLGTDCDLRASDVQSHGMEGIAFRLLFDGQVHYVRAPLLGRHSVHTVLAAFAVGSALGMEIDEMLRGLEDPSVQLRLYTVPGINGATIIDDAYNANPESTLAALNLLADLDAKRRIAVLGDMLELGTFEDEGHRIVGRRAAHVADLLLTLGDKARIIAEEAIVAGMPADAVQASLRATLRPGDIVLVKGSRGIKMEDIVNQIRDRQPATDA